MGRDFRLQRNNLFSLHFYSHAPCGARQICESGYIMRPLISTHTPLAGRDSPDFDIKETYWDFYSHAPRGARHDDTTVSMLLDCISTHTPLAGRDEKDARGGTRYRISTHTPLAGRDDLCRPQCFVCSHFYSHAPRGARHMRSKCRAERKHFYSHAPRGARPVDLNAARVLFIFLLTRPSRGATRGIRQSFDVRT